MHTFTSRAYRVTVLVRGHAMSNDVNIDGVVLEIWFKLCTRQCSQTCAYVHTSFAKVYNAIFGQFYSMTAKSSHYTVAPSTYMKFTVLKFFVILTSTLIMSQCRNLFITLVVRDHLLCWKGRYANSRRFLVYPVICYFKSVPSWTK